jgi:hypothetical protein
MSGHARENGTRLPTPSDGMPDDPGKRPGGG